MPKGSSSRSGPAPDPNALRRDRKSDGEWITLPAGGRTSPAPEWPLTDPTPREEVLWDRWWRKPEAFLWESDGSCDYVALTVRMFAEAEVEKASAENRKTVRMMMADLYLTRDAKARARIQVATVDTPGPAVLTPVRSTSSRDRLTVVRGGDA